MLETLRRVLVGPTYRVAVPTDEEIGFPSGTPDERELLLRWLTFLRGAVIRKVEGLNDDDARWTPDGKLISLLGIVNHLTNVEWRWIDGGMLGHDVTKSDDEYSPRPELTVDAALVAYRERGSPRTRWFARSRHSPSHANGVTTRTCVGCCCI